MTARPPQLSLLDRSLMTAADLACERLIDNQDNLLALGDATPPQTADEEQARVCAQIRRDCDRVKIGNLVLSFDAGTESPTNERNPGDPITDAERHYYITMYAPYCVRMTLSALGPWNAHTDRMAKGGPYGVTTQGDAIALAYEILCKIMDGFDPRKGSAWSRLRILWPQRLINEWQAHNRRDAARQHKTVSIDALEADGVEFAAPAPLVDTDTLLVAMDLLSRLPEVQRRAIILIKVEQLTYAEAAEELGLKSYRDVDNVLRAALDAVQSMAKGMGL